MAKPVYSLVYAIIIGIGLLALVLFNRMLSSNEAAPAAQASLQRNEATAREAREAVSDGAEKTGPGEPAEPATGKADAPASPPAAQADAMAKLGGKDEDERK